MEKDQETPVFEAEVGKTAFEVDINEIADFEEDEGPDEDDVFFGGKKPTEIDNPANTDPEEEEDEQEEEEEEKEEEEDGNDPSDEEEEEQEEENEPVDDDEYEGYSESAKIALAEVKEGYFNLDEKDIPEDLDAGTLRKMYNKVNEMRLNQEKENIYNQAGEASEFLKFLLDGGDPRAVQEAISNRDIINLDIGDEENQRKVLTALYQKKDLPEEDVKDMVETILDKGLGKERAEQAQGLFEKEEKQILERHKEQQKLQKEQEERRKEEYIQNMESIIDKGEISGYKLDKNKAKRLKEAMFKPTEVVEVQDPNTGQSKKVRATKTQVLQQKLNQDPEMFLAFNLWLLEGGDFNFVKEQAYEESDDDLRALLQGKQKKSKRKLRKSGKGFEKFMTQ